MFQHFETGVRPGAARDRVAKLRALMAGRRLDAYLVPRADEHQGEYVPPSSERLKWLTGFSGSAGLAVIGATTAALFVDGRYTVQVKAETDPKLFAYPATPRGKLADWLAETLPKESRIGFDPWVHTAGEVQALATALKAKGLKLVPTPRNLVDLIWGSDQPTPPANPMTVHPLEFAGRSAREKLADVQAALAKDGQDALVLTAPESICWLFNVRGSDVPHNPVALAFAIVPASGKAELFVADEKVTPELRKHLKGVAEIVAPARLRDRIAGLRREGKRVRLDFGAAAYWFARVLGPKSAINGYDPCLMLKACKNPVEIEGARAAHVRDGAAVTAFLAWLDRESGDGSLDEISAVRQLETFRRAGNRLREISFDTISGSGPNGAIVHYRVNEATNRALKPGELFLIDSGGQYADGTTDVTRTVAIGEPSREMIERFTLVLKGHIAVASAVFPKGVRGVDLDPFARRALWERGLDYDHGTGHGIGSFLSVHEGPQSISKGGVTELKPGMICSNEPGYYKEGAYGIRIENVVLVTEAAKLPGADRETMFFETLTLAPIDRRLIDKSMLSADEIDWLDAYHARVWTTLQSEVDDDTRSWLKTATAQL